MGDLAPRLVTTACLALLVVGCATGDGASSSDSGSGGGGSSSTPHVDAHEDARDASHTDGTSIGLFQDATPNESSTTLTDASADSHASDAEGTTSSDAAHDATHDVTFDADGAIIPDATSALHDSGVCSTGATQSCTTSCGSTGTETCAAGVWSACAPPAEVCNLVDDSCSGSCDDLLGCRVGIDRAFDKTNGLHFYTATDSEADCCGYTAETFDDFYLYNAAQPGLVPFYRCSTAAGSHLYTTDATCEGNTVEGSMGWIATSAVCGSVPLYRLDDATSGDHLYTTSSAEVTAAQSSGYVLNTTAGYVWPSAGGSTSSTWPSPISMVGSNLTAATGFPTAWYGYPINGTESLSTLTGSVSMTNSANLFSEVLFILKFLPTGTCTIGRWPASTPEYGPAGSESLAQFIVKSPTTGTVTVPINLTLPGGLPMTGCVLLGLNGGTVATSHDVTAAASLTATFTAPVTPTQSLLIPAGEFCFGQNGGCQASTTNDTQSFATVTPITSTTNLVALYGDISDSTFDGTSSFGAPPSGAWTATNDFYIYHGTDCASFGVTSGTAGPGNYTTAVPTSATHLLSVPLSGTGIGVAQKQVFQSLSGMTASAGDCLVALWGLQGGGAFDNETQVFALVAP